MPTTTLCSALSAASCSKNELHNRSPKIIQSSRFLMKRFTENQSYVLAAGLPPQIAERLLAYEEAKAAGTHVDAEPSTMETAARDRLARDIACVNLLHRAWSVNEIRPQREDVLPAKVLGDYRLIR